MEKVEKQYMKFSPAMNAASILANMDKIPYYIYENQIGESFKVTNFKITHRNWALNAEVHPFEPSEMTNKENT